MKSGMVVGQLEADLVKGDCVGRARRPQGLGEAQSLSDSNWRPL